MLWGFAKDLSDKWPHKMEFYEELANKINAKAPKERYVPLDRIKVKDKFACYRGRYQKFLKGKVFAPLLKVLCTTPARFCMLT